MKKGVDEEGGGREVKWFQLICEVEDGRGC